MSEALIVGATLNAGAPTRALSTSSMVERADLPPESFTDPKAKRIWTIILKFVREGRPVSVETVHHYGRATKLFSEKDLSWLLMWESDAIVLSPDTFGELADVQRKTWRVKRLAQALEEQRDALRGADPDLAVITEKLETVAKSARTSAGGIESTGDLDLASVDDDWTRAEKGDAPGIVPTGIVAIDQLVRGFVPNLNMLIGPPGGGKSATEASCILAQLEMGYRVGFVGLEDGSKWIPRRVIAKELGWPLIDVGRKPRDRETNDKLANIYERLAEPLSRLRTYPRGGITARELLDVARRWRKKDPVTGKPGIDILWIDHGGELDHSSHDVDEHRLRVGLSYRMLRDFAFEEGFPIVSLAHTRRKDDRDTEPRPPRPFEVRDSSDIENAARVMFGMWWHPDDHECFRITSLKMTEAERDLTWLLPRFTKAALIDVQNASTVDLKQERIQKAKAKREEKEAERKAAREKRLAEKAAEKEHKARKAAQSSMFTDKEKDS